MTHVPRLKRGLHAVTVDGRTLRYRVAGDGPVLIVQPPGWGVGAAPYEETLARLERSFTLVYLHPRGSAGEAAAPASALHVAAFVEDIESVRRHLGLDAFALAGHSHGGLIALHYALRHPSRVRALVLLTAQLVGVRPHPAEEDGRVDPQAEPEIGDAFRYLDSVGGFDRLFTARTDEDFTAFMLSIAPLYFKDPRHAAPLRAMLEARPLPVRTMQAVSSSDAAFPLEDGALRACSVPTLVVSGRYDLFCPPSPARRLAEALPAAQRVVFEKSGHFPWLEEPEAFFPAIERFLAETTMISAR